MAKITSAALASTTSVLNLSTCGVLSFDDGDSISGLEYISNLGSMLFLCVNSSTLPNECDFAPIPLSHHVLMLVIFIYLLIIVLALFGNVLVMAIIGLDQKMRTVTNVLLLSLAGNDVLIAGLNMPFQLRFLVQNEWTMGEGLCKFTNYIQGVVVVSSIFTLSGIAIDRYYAICRPLQARHLHTSVRALMLISCFWVTSLILLIPQLFIQRLEPFLLFNDEEQRFQTVEICVEYFSDYRLNVAYTLFFYAALYLLPVAIIFIAYGRIAVTLWRRSPLAEAETSTAANRLLTEKKRIVRMLVVIVSVFVVTWFPFFTAQVYLLVDVEECHHQYEVRVTVAILQLVAYSNCCINPIVYCLLNDSFKQRLRRALAGACTKRRVRRLTESGRRATLTETLRTTAGLVQSSTRRASCDNEVLVRCPVRPVLSHPPVVEEEKEEQEKMTYWFSEVASARGCSSEGCYGDGWYGEKCYGNGSLIPGLSPGAVALGKVKQKGLASAEGISHSLHTSSFAKNRSKSLPPATSSVGRPASFSPAALSKEISENWATFPFSKTNFKTLPTTATSKVRPESFAWTASSKERSEELPTSAFSKETLKDGSSSKSLSKSLNAFESISLLNDILKYWSPSKFDEFIKDSISMDISKVRPSPESASRLSPCLASALSLKESSNARLISKEKTEKSPDCSESPTESL